jgi:hypothetical protein
MRLAGSELLLQEFSIKTTLFESTMRRCENVTIDKLPTFVKYLKNLVARRGNDHAEPISMSTENFYPIVRHTNETKKGIALITDLSQQATLSISLLLNFPHRHVAMLTGAAA